MMAKQRGRYADNVVLGRYSNHADQEGTGSTGYSPVSRQHPQVPFIDPLCICVGGSSRIKSKNW